MIGARIPKLTDVNARLAAMDAQGVDRQWVSVSPNHFYPWAPEGLAVWVAMETNRLIAAHVAQAPDRLTGLGVVPLQHPSRIVEYLDDAILGRGLAGVEISSFAGDVELSDERLEPFWARAAELGAVVFLHPFGCSLDERLDRFYLSNTVGQPAENAVALSHLIFAGVLDRHPDLKIVAAHGGRIPALRDRALRPGLAGAPRGAALRARSLDLPAEAVVRHRRARPGRPAAPRRSGGRIAGAAGQRLPVRHGARRSRRVRAGRGPARRDRAAHPRGQRRGAARDEGARMRIARWAGPARRGVAEGFVVDDRVIPFPDGLTVADVLAGGLDAAHAAYARVDAEAGTRLADVRLLAPLVPASVRDFVAFEEHVEGISASVDGKSEVVPEWYQAPTFYFTNPHTILGPRRRRRPARDRAARLRARDRRRPGRRAPGDEPHAGGRAHPASSATRS